MRMIDGIPQVLTGEAYYPHVKVPVPNYQQTAHGYEINLAVSDEVFQQFKDAGFNVGLQVSVRSKYTEDPVVHFYKWEVNGKGEKNAVPKLGDAEKNEIDVVISVDDYNKPQIEVKYFSYEKSDWVDFNYTILLDEYDVDEEQVSNQPNLKLVDKEED